MLVVKDVTKQYGNFTALKGINLELEKYDSFWNST